MPFALHTMDPGCPVVAIADDPSAAWEAADRMGLPRAKALVMPCAMTLPQAARATDETHRARAERDAMRETRDRAIADVETIRKRTPDRVIAEMERIRDELSRGLDALRADIAATRPDDASKSTEAA